MTDQTMRTAIRDALGAHGAWKLKLRTAVITGRSELSPDTARCDDKCAFGKWLHGTAIDPETRSGKPYQVVRRLHAEFHVAAADVLDAALHGDRNHAETLLTGTFEPRSDILKRALVKWMGELAHT